MSTRESRRLKEKRTMIPFGDIMLPVIGLVAVGLLIVGVKLFFLTEPKIPNYRPIGQDSAPGKVEVKTLPSPVPESRPASRESAFLAAPVGGSGSSESRPTGSQAKPSVQPIAKSAEPKAEPAPQKPAQPQSRPQPQPQPQTKPAPVGKSKWGVQIGSFGAKDGAETVRQQAAKAGYSSVISSAVVGGKTFFRVTVPAGNDRGGAENLAARLKSSGFPVLVVGMN